VQLQFIPLLHPDQQTQYDKYKSSSDIPFLSSQHLKHSVCPRSKLIYTLSVHHLYTSIPIRTYFTPPTMILPMSWCQSVSFYSPTHLHLHTRNYTTMPSTPNRTASSLGTSPWRATCLTCYSMICPHLQVCSCDIYSFIVSAWQLPRITRSMRTTLKSHRLHSGGAICLLW
jgi:hypothetical protein